MLLFLLTWIIRILDVVFFAGLFGCLLVIFFSWISIFLEALSSD
jgi:hypothetical protein